MTFKGPTRIYDEGMEFFEGGIQFQTENLGGQYYGWY